MPITSHEQERKHAVTNWLGKYVREFRETYMQKTKIHKDLFLSTVLYLPCTLSIFRSMTTRHRGPNLFMAQIAKMPLNNEMPARMVNSHPLPMALIKGSVNAAPMQLNMFLTKLFSATPLLALRGMNSVNIVVTPAKILHPH
jgi:hypothetical protein